MSRTKIFLQCLKQVKHFTTPSVQSQFYNKSIPPTSSVITHRHCLKPCSLLMHRPPFVPSMPSLGVFSASAGAVSTGQTTPPHEAGHAPHGQTTPPHGADHAPARGRPRPARADHAPGRGRPRPPARGGPCPRGPVPPGEMADWVGGRRTRRGWEGKRRKRVTGHGDQSEVPAGRVWGSGGFSTERTKCPRMRVDTEVDKINKGKFFVVKVHLIKVVRC